MIKRPLCLVCLLLMLGMLAADLAGFPLIRGNPLPESIQEFIQEHPEATICGEVERCTTGESSQSVYLKDVFLIYHSKKYSIKKVRAYLKKEEDLPVGTCVYLSGNLEEVGETRNPGEFDSRQYYACEHIYYFMKKAVVEKKSEDYSAYGQFLVDVRENLAAVLKKAAKEESAVFRAVVLGDKEELSSETKLRYQMGGIVHILAISGLHISTLGVGLYKLLKKIGLGIWPAGLLALIFMLNYGMMTGSSVSTMRAVCMFLLSVGAKILGRIYDLPTALAVSAMLLLVESPAYLYSSGFLLSFVAVLGISLVSPALLGVTGVKNKVGAALLSSFGVQMATLPVTLYFFGEVSVAGVFLNLVVLPTVGIVLASGVAAAILGMLWLPAGAAAALPGRLLLFIYEKLCLVAGTPWVGGQPALWKIGLYYGLSGLIFGFFFWMKKKLHSRLLQIVLPVLCLLLSGAVLGGAPSPYLRITCLDVGQGDGICIETPQGYCYLMDGGSSSKSKVGQYQILPYLKSRGISRVNGIFISHVDEDHISGIREILTMQAEGLTAVKVRNLYLPDWKDPPEAWKELKSLAEQAGTVVHTVQAGDCLEAGDLQLCALAPQAGATGEDTNEESVVLELWYKDFRGLLTGDIGEETEEELLPALDDVDFLKVAHHGSRYSTGTAFLEQVRPEWAVISCSSTNTYGHPSPDTVHRLEQIDCRVGFTMQSGAVTLYTDGTRIRMQGYLTP